MTYRIKTSIDRDWLFELVEKLTKGVPDGCRLIYSDRNQVYTYKPALGTVVNIKSFKIPILINKIIYGWIRKSKARRSYEHALRLLQMGIGTPPPYCYMEQHNWLGWLNRSYYISEQLDNDWTEVRGMEERADSRNILRALAVWLAGIHQRGILIKDLSPGNIMMKKMLECYAFQLVDLNRMKFGCTKRLDMLRRTGRLFQSEASSLEFAKYYAEVSGMDPMKCQNMVVKSFYKRQRQLGVKR